MKWAPMSILSDLVQFSLKLWAKWLNCSSEPEFEEDAAVAPLGRELKIEQEQTSWLVMSCDGKCLLLTAASLHWQQWRVRP